MSQSTKITTGLVRFSYVKVFEPFAFNESDTPKYSMQIIIPKTDKATLARIKAAQQAAKQEGITKVWGGKEPKGLKNTLRDGDVDGDRPELEGAYYMSLSSLHKPQVVDSNLNAVIDPSEVYSGCYGRVSINFAGYSHAGNRGITGYLGNVQKLKDGENLGGGSSAETDFGKDDFADDFKEEAEDMFDL